MLAGIAAPTAIASGAERVSAQAHGALMDELRTWPKPGLVSPVDGGSHRDMDFALLARSAGAIRPFFALLARAGERGAGLAELRRIGLAAEAAMMSATGGVNAHRGAIFSIGLLSAAAGAHGYVPETAEAWAQAVGTAWGDAILKGPAPALSNGGAAARRFGVGGARAEAAAGFPIIREVGLPALRAGRRLVPGDEEAARVHCLFALMAVLDDTNLLHRGGACGLAFAKREAQDFLTAGGVGAPGWRDLAGRTHRAFVARNLSPGGSADLLAACLFLARCGAIGTEARSSQPASYARADGPFRQDHAGTVGDEGGGDRPARAASGTRDERRPARRRADDPARPGSPTLPRHRAGPQRRRDDADPCAASVPPESRRRSLQSEARSSGTGQAEV